MILIEGISKTHKTGSLGVKALVNLSLKIDDGDFVAIMGPSGSGKSTLLHIIGLLDKPDSGKYYLGKSEITKLDEESLALLRNSFIGFIFQKFHLLPKNTALENVELPLIYAGKRELKSLAEEKISQVGLKTRALHRPNQLSGGEQQRVAIARSLVNDPVLILADEPTGNLDSKNQDEIMAILKELNRQGKTIVLVTHEIDVAKNASRIIKMRDGEIVSDERTSPPASNPISSEVISEKGILNRASSVIKKAEFIDHLKQAFYALTAHKLRSTLSMLGILIGVSAVIAMLALGQGARESIKQRLASLGSNLLMIMPGSAKIHGVSLEAGSVTRFTLQDADDIAKLDGVKNVSPTVRGRGQLLYRATNWNSQLQGTGVGYATMRASVPILGRFFTEEELRVRKRVAVIGTTVVRELFGDADPIGEIIKINKVSFQVIGVLPAKGASAWRDEDDMVIIPVTTAMYRVMGKEYLDSIDVEVEEQSMMQSVQNEIQELIIKRHRLTKDNEDSFQIRNMADIQATLESTTKTMTLLLGFIAAISLLVGGMGIMNIMLVSVTERTREIGLRKAIGGRRKDILAQFLIESITLTFSGGIIGIILGVVAAATLSIFAGWTTKISLFAIILATTFSVATGMIFGLWPAQKASKLDPVEALRYE